jgi:hypothetical protein
MDDRKQSGQPGTRKCDRYGTAGTPEIKEPMFDTICESDDSVTAAWDKMNDDFDTNDSELLNEFQGGLSGDDID